MLFSDRRRIRRHRLNSRTMSLEAHIVQKHGNKSSTWLKRLLENLIESAIERGKRSDRGNHVSGPLSSSAGRLCSATASSAHPRMLIRFNRDGELSELFPVRNGSGFKFGIRQACVSNSRYYLTRGKRRAFGVVGQRTPQTANSIVIAACFSMTITNVTNSRRSDIKVQWQPAKSPGPVS
jgi:hypothetical protein